MAKLIFPGAQSHSFGWMGEYELLFVGVKRHSVDGFIDWPSYLQCELHCYWSGTTELVPYTAFSDFPPHKLSFYSSSFSLSHANIGARPNAIAKRHRRLIRAYHFVRCARHPERTAIH